MKSKTVLRIWTASFPLSIIFCAILFLLLNCAKGQSVYVRDLIAYQSDTTKRIDYTNNRTWWQEHDPTSAIVIIGKWVDSPYGGQIAFYFKEYNKTEGIISLTMYLYDAKLYKDCNECDAYKELENDVRILTDSDLKPELRFIWMQLY